MSNRLRAEAITFVVGGGRAEWLEEQCAQVPEVSESRPVCGVNYK